MSNLRQAAQQALEALEGFDNFRRIMSDGPDASDKVFAEDHAEVAFVAAARVIPALRAALAEPQTTHWEGCEAVHPECKAPLTPRKPLTDEEIVDIWAGVSMDYDDEINIIELARAIERAHGIGEQA